MSILRRLWPRRKPQAHIATKDPGSFLDMVNETHQVMSEASDQILAAVESRRREVE